MTPMRTLYIDMNSFFASVEKQVDPSIRNRPLAITAVSADSGAVVAACYKAKKYGVGVGVRIWQAKNMCPGIVFRPSRHRLYVRFNQRIAAEIDKLAELERIRSVDEFQVVLGGSTSELEQAMALARRIKRAILDNVGDQLTCSIGIGPNQLLAKIAGKLEKPDGLQWLAPENMPEKIAHLKPDDLPGISKGIKARLARANIWDTDDLYRLDPRHARKIWNSVEGERFVRALQGEDIPLIETQRNGYGQSKVLAPAYRAPNKAYLVGRWLVEKATERMRRDGYCTRRFALFVRHYDDRGWSGSQSLTPSQDTQQLLSIYDKLWRQMRGRCQGQVCGSVSIHLGDVILLSQRSGELFLPLEAGKQSRREILAQTVDRINQRYRQRVVTFGLQQEHPGFFEKG